MELTAEKLVQENLGLVGYTIGKYTNPAYTKANPLYNYEDLFQVGSIGLIKAANAFDENKGVKFTSFAVKVIKNEIYKALSIQSQHEDTSSFADRLEFNEANVKGTSSIQNELGCSFLIDEYSKLFKEKERRNVEIFLEYLSLGYRQNEAASKAGLTARKAYYIVDRIKTCVKVENKK